MRILLICSILLLASCTPKEPEKSWTGIARILPIIVKNTNGDTQWTNALLSKGFKSANDYWLKTGIQFIMLDPEIVVDDKMFDQDGYIEFSSLMLKSGKIAKARHAYPVYFVESIKWGDNEYGGMSTSANAPLGFQYGTTVSAVVRNGSGLTIAHELGHAWSLRHTWSDKHDDTPSVDSSDCNDQIHCNVMSYCFGGIKCTPLPFFSPEQISELRSWALSSSRLHLLETDIQVKQTVLPLLSEPEITLDPVFGK
jgi:hypothetical protein